MKKKSLDEKLLEKIIKSENPDHCWGWTGFHQKGGYGHISHKGKTLIASRAYYITFIGDIPEGLEVCHSCDTPTCCNPKHLFLGTHKQNMKDMAKKHRGTTGEKATHSKLNNELVLEIRGKYISGHPECGMRALARKYGINIHTIHKVIHRNTWIHI